MESRENVGESPPGRHSAQQLQTGAPRTALTLQNIDMKTSGNVPSRHASAFRGVASPDLSLHPGRGAPRKSYSVKWLVGISAAGIFISGLVLFQLLYTTRPVTIRSVGDLYQRSSSSAVISKGKFSRTNLVFMGKKSSKGFYNESGDARARNYHRFMMNSVEKAMNTSVDPCHDFYQYACGRWGVHNPPPSAAVARWTNFDDMTLRLWKLMEGKLRVLAKDSSPTQHSHDNNLTESTPSLHNALLSVTVLMVDYYKSCENEELLSRRGVTPLQDVLNEMDQLYLAASQKLQPLHVFQKVLEFVHHKLSFHVFFSWKVEADPTVQDAMTIELNVPNADFIQQGTELKGKERLINMYGQYAKTLLKMVGTFNNNSLDNEVNAILELFRIFLPMKGSSIVRKMTIKDLNELAPILDWQGYFNSAFNRVGTHITKDEYVLLQVHEYLHVLSKHITEISTWGLERLYVYLRWQVAQFYSQFLHKPARDALLPLITDISNVNIYTIPHFRLRPCIKEVAERLPLATGHLLLETLKEGLPKKASISDNIKAVTEMANIIRMEYLSYIESFTWLKENAKRFLMEKLINTNIKVGYPPIVDNLPELHKYFKSIKFTTNYFTNQMALLKFNRDHLMRLLRQPGLYSEWQGLSPVSVISFYMYHRNALLIPLGGIMHPVYNTNLPIYMTYATMGSLISHELGHAVDLVGCTRDLYGKANGTLWDEVTVEAFLERVTCRVKQYSQAYYPIQNLLTVSEVMADDASVCTAFMAASQHFQHIKLPATIINSLAKLDLSSEQFFFLYYAQMFCSTSSPGSPLKHYPPDWARVTATLASTPQFQAAFSCHKGTTMNPVTENCQIW